MKEKSHALQPVFVHCSPHDACGKMSVKKSTCSCDQRMGLSPTGCASNHQTRRCRPEGVGSPPVKCPDLSQPKVHHSLFSRQQMVIADPKTRDHREYVSPIHGRVYATHPNPPRPIPCCPRPCGPGFGHVGQGVHAVNCRRAQLSQTWGRL